MRLLIVGFGYVGKAISFAFSKGTECKVIDPIIHSLTLDEIVDWNPDFTFICVGTPSLENGTCDYSQVLTMAAKVAAKWPTTTIVLKSTVTPDGVKQLLDITDKIIVNPEFLTARNSLHDIIQNNFAIIGASTELADNYLALIRDHSEIMLTQYTVVTPIEACMTKYAINCFLALKVGFFNEMFDVAESLGVDWNNVIDSIRMDPRIGNTHMQVPGMDGNFGFGGACFPKDTKALEVFATNIGLKMPILSTTIAENNKRRGINS